LNDLWRGHYLASGKWQELRDHDNLVHGRVFYLFGSIQLIKQTAEAASSMPLKVATYYDRNQVNEADFNKGDVLCITTYQALYNGVSRFAKENISGLIFDDGHGASHIIRDYFTLRLTDEAFSWNILHPC
jgi:hypothetical protein